MRAVYRNPKELATCIKDTIDTYHEDLITYEKLEEKLMAMVKANGDRVYKDGFISIKLENVLGNERVSLLNEIVNKNK